MNVFRRRSALFIILAVLAVSLLPSCSTINKDVNRSPETPVSGNTSAADESPSSSAPVNKLSYDDIRGYIEKTHSGTEVEILDAQSIGEDFMLVEYNLKISTNRFVLCNLVTGQYDLLPIQDVVLKKIVSENYFIFEDRGEFTDSAFRFFPSIVKCFRVFGDKNEYENFTAVYEREYFELDRSVRAGSKKNGVLSAISVTFDGFDVMFRPQAGNEAAFYADATDIPPVKTSYDAEANRFTVEIDTELLGPGLQSGVNIETADNIYISSYEIIQKDNKTYIAASLRETALRYMICSRGDDFPFFSVAFVRESDVPADY